MEKAKNKEMVFNTFLKNICILAVLLMERETEKD
jgi:hypothetical protein